MPTAKISRRRECRQAPNAGLKYPAPSANAKHPAPSALGRWGEPVSVRRPRIAA